MALAQPKMADIADLIRSGQQNAETRWKELREDFEKKHQENRERRHAMAGDIQLIKDQQYILSERVRATEDTLRTVVGDNSGGSGLLHAIDKKVDELKNDVTALKAAVQDSPSIRKWVLMAAGVFVFLGVVMPIIVTIVLAIIFRH